MKTIFKIVLSFSFIVFSLSGYSQNADLGIGIIMSPPTVMQGSTGILSANVGNYGNDSIVANSIIVTITVGINAEIIGLSSGGDSRWTLFSLTPGSANTIKLTNTGGGFSPFDVGDILLIVKGNVISTPNLIFGNISYLTGTNPLLCATCLNSSQGDALTSNNDSQTSIAVSYGNGDLDGDGDPDSSDPNPTNPCIYGTGQVLANATTAWNALDCDLDGNPNGTDPHVLLPIAQNDVLTAPFGQASSVNILANDDFLANDGNTINQAPGGTAGGVVTFDPVSGIMSYTPLASESGSAVTVVYEVCQGTVCATASVLISIPCPIFATPLLSIVTQPTCSESLGSFTITNYNATYTYAVTPSIGVTILAGTISAPAGSYTLTASIGNCISSASSPVVINSQPASLVTPTLSLVTQPTCSESLGSFTITNYNASYTYTVTPTVGVAVSGSTITAPAGSYTIAASIGNCISSASSPVVINSQPASLVTPTLSLVTQPTCSESLGSFTITNYNASYTYTVTPTVGVAVSGSTITAPAGSYIITASIGNCISSASSPIVINSQPSTLLTPTLSLVTQPTCSESLGSFTITNYNASYTYTVTPTVGVAVSGTTITAPAGSYTITASIGNCISSTSIPVLINSQPATLLTPTLSLVTQPTCSESLGSFTITNYNATYTYAVTPSMGVTILAGTITAPAGSYSITANSGGCISPNSLPIILNAVNYSNCASIAVIKTAHLVDLNQDGIAQVGENIIYTFVITNTGLVPLTNITLSDPLPGILVTGGPISLGVGNVDSTSFNATYAVTVQDIINGSVSNQATVFGTSPSGIIVNDLSDSTSNSGNSATITEIKGCHIEVFNAVTPNNDGNNDYFYIRGLDCFTENSVEIYNRWGVKVFEIANYDNNLRVFNGYSEGRVNISQTDALPNGTYYYILKYKEFNGDTLTKTGFLYLTQ